MWLTVTSSPGVRGISITSRDRILVVHLYAGSVYVAAVAQNRECLADSREFEKAAWLLTRLMDRVGKLAKSRYYTYTGVLELGDVLRYRPYVTPTSMVEIAIDRNIAVVEGGGFRRRYRTAVDVASVLRSAVEFMEKC